MHTIHVVHLFAANVRFDTQALLLLCSSAFSSFFFFLFRKIVLRAASTRKLAGSVPGRVRCAQAAAIASLTRLLSASADAGLTTDRFHAIPG